MSNEDGPLTDEERVTLLEYQNEMLLARIAKLEAVAKAAAEINEDMESCQSCQGCTDRFTDDRCTDCHWHTLGNALAALKEEA
jgi:hypothetical protein